MIVCGVAVVRIECTGICACDSDDCTVWCVLYLFLVIKFLVTRKLDTVHASRAPARRAGELLSPRNSPIHPYWGPRSGSFVSNTSFIHCTTTSASSETLPMEQFSGSDFGGSPFRVHAPGLVSMTLKSFGAKRSAILCSVASALATAAWSWQHLQPALAGATRVLCHSRLRHEQRCGPCSCHTCQPVPTPSSAHSGRDPLCQVAKALVLGAEDTHKWSWCAAAKCLLGCAGKGALVALAVQCATAPHTKFRS